MFTDDLFHVLIFDLYLFNMLWDDEQLPNMILEFRMLQLKGFFRVKQFAGLAIFEVEFGLELNQALLECYDLLPRLSLCLVK